MQAILCSGQVKDIDSLELIQIIDNKIDTFIGDFKVPGAIISVVKDGELFYTKGIGYDNLETQKEVDPMSSQFRVASITKTFTAIGIMQLVEQGKLDLHADIRTYLPADIYQWDAPQSFTIHHLLTHTAGLEHSEYRVSQESIVANSLDVFVQTAISNQIHKPGELFSYSNKGYGILGLLIEKTSGLKYEDYIAQNILEPMGMMHSTVYQHTEESPIDRAVQPYRWDGDQYIPRERLFLVNPAASNLNTTGVDMALFMTAMMDSAQVDGQSIISKASFELMLQRHYAPSMDFEAMGYGMMIEDNKGYAGYNHGGGIDGFGSYYIFYPELNLGLFMSESGGQENAAFAFRVIYGILDELIVKKEQSEEIAVPLEVAISQAEMYAGTYQQTTVTKSTFERGQMLFGINEQVIEHVGEGQITYRNNVYKPLDNNTYQQVDGTRKIGFFTEGHGAPMYFSERLFWTLEKINWFQSANTLRITLGCSLLMLLIGLVIRPLIQLKKDKRSIQWKSMMSIVATCLTFGFGLLLCGYVFEIELTRGTPMIYKVGMFLTTLGAILFALYPISLIRKWNSLLKVDKQWVIFNVVALLLLVVCYWRVNLIGFNYY